MGRGGKREGEGKKRREGGQGGLWFPGALGPMWEAGNPGPFARTLLPSWALPFQSSSASLFPSLPDGSSQGRLRVKLGLPGKDIGFMDNDLGTPKPSILSRK